MKTATVRVQLLDLASQRRRIAPELDAALRRVLDHGKFIMGPEVDELEQALAGISGVKHCVSCASGTDALLLALLAIGAGPGCAVFVPSFTFVATAECCSLLGATPVFVDVDPETFTMDPASLQEAIEDLPRSLRGLAAIPVDLFGQPADYVALRAVTEVSGIQLVADAAQSFGATIAGRPVGSLVELTCTSFFPSKPLGCYGDGGAVFTSEPELSERMRSLRVHGAGSDKYDTVRIGLNARLDTIQAAVLLTKLRIFSDELRARDELASHYGKSLPEEVSPPAIAPGRTSAWAQYTIRHSARDRLRLLLGERGVPTAVYYPLPLHQLRPFRDCPRSPRGLGVSESLADSVFSLPMHPYVTAGQRELIIEAVEDALGAI